MDKKIWLLAIPVVLAVFVFALVPAKIMPETKTITQNTGFFDTVYIYKNNELVTVTHNTITNGAMNYVRGALEYTGTVANVTNITVGLGQTTAQTDTALIGIDGTNGFAGKYGTCANNTGNGNWSCATTFTATGASTLNATGMYISGGGALFAYANFTSTTFAALDTLTINWTFSVS